jgi:hypothetical protein
LLKRKKLLRRRSLSRLLFGSYAGIEDNLAARSPVRGHFIILPGGCSTVSPKSLTPKSVTPKS